MKTPVSRQAIAACVVILTSTFASGCAGIQMLLPNRQSSDEHRQDDNAEVIRLFQRKQERKISEAELTRLARILSDHQNRYSDAVSLMQAAINQHPMSTAYYLELSRIYSLHSRHDIARTTLLECVGHRAADSEVLEDLGDECMSLRLFEEATRHYRASLKLNSQSSSCKASLALANKEIKNPFAPKGSGGSVDINSK